MPFQETKLEGVLLFVPTVFDDFRGKFFESFKTELVLSETGLEFSVAQVNNSISSKGVIRGIHFKQNPPGQRKFVSVSAGAIIDVSIDLRRNSPTFGKWQAIELNDTDNHSLLIGNGIGHAFLSLRDDTSVSYLCDTAFEPQKELGLNPLSAGIDWENLAIGFDIGEFILSEKDRRAPHLGDIYSYEW